MGAASCKFSRKVNEIDVDGNGCCPYLAARMPDLNS